ncbi:MAG: thioredoxin domain-containing protein [Gemmatimonadales bacterium]
MNVKEVASFSMSVVAVACAVVATVTFVRANRSGNRPLPSGFVPNQPPTTVKNWEALKSEGHRLGPADAPVTIVEFADFECPACRGFALRSLKMIRAKYPEGVALVFRHWPLEYHRFAYTAARAAECAGVQGRFFEYHDLLYAKQDSLGLKSFQSFAKDAGVPDDGRFISCVSRRDSVPAIKEDVRVVLALRGTGTPTILVNGLQYSTVPDSATLDSIVGSVIHRNQP